MVDDNVYSLQSRNCALPEIRRGSLRRRLKSGAKLRIMEAHSGVSALVATAAKVPIIDGGLRGFDGLWISSLTAAVARGLPDMELLGLERRQDLLSEIANVSPLPIIVDGDTGGDPVNFEYTCRMMEAVGVSGIIIEDKAFPKRNSLSESCNHVLEDPAIFSRKIERGKAALRTDELMIIARLEGLIAGKSIEDCVDRALAYQYAGCDGIMVHSKSYHGNDVLELIDLYRARSSPQTLPVVVVPTTYSQFRAEALFAGGADVVIYANHSLRASHRAMENVCLSILANDRSMECTTFCTGVSTLLEVSGYNEAVRRSEVETPQ